MTGNRYAQGSRAWGECQRSGKRMLLKDMVEDPLTGMMVAPDWAEPPLQRPPTDIFDATNLYRPAPDLDVMDTVIAVGQAFDLSTGDPMRPLVSMYEMGLARVGA